MNWPHLCVAVCLGVLADDTLAKSPQMPAPRADMPTLAGGCLAGGSIRGVVHKNPLCDVPHKRRHVS